MAIYNKKNLNQVENVETSKPMHYQFLTLLSPSSSLLLNKLYYYNHLLAKLLPLSLKNLVCIEHSWYNKMLNVLFWGSLYFPYLQNVNAMLMDQYPPLAIWMDCANVKRISFPEISALNVLLDMSHFLTVQVHITPHFVVLHFEVNFL